LYGTAFYSGAHNYGVVFELSPTGKTWAEHVLYAFAGGSDGANPTSGLIFDTAGNLFGTTDFGGANGVGTVFELSPSGGAWTEHVIYNTVDSTGHGTTAGLVMDAAGNLFGTTSSSFFEVSPDGKGGWSAKVIHTFLGGAKDGNYAAGTPALDDVGNVYGTTFYGGKYNYGTVYELVRGKKKWTEKILLNFKRGSHGSDPLAGVVLDAARNVYGTTTGGGRSGFGTVFELVAPLTKGAYKEKVLWSFGNTDGNEPFGTLMMDSLGNIYGTTGYGGSSGNGVVFQVVP